MAGGLCLCGAAHAEIYKSVGPDGRVTYSNIPSKGATKLNLEPLTTVAPPKPKTATPAGFPKVDGETQKKRDDTRRKILEDELAAEEKLLAEAKKNLAEGEEVRLGGERNYQKYLDRIQALKDEVTLHEKNVEALKKELAGVK
ncbi:MAG: DUF4124 domain-containing protein [Pseudomonadota bacterium]|jgi:hypothetical protein